MSIPRQHLERQDTRQPWENGFGLSAIGLNSSLIMMENIHVKNCRGHMGAILKYLSKQLETKCSCGTICLLVGIPISIFVLIVIPISLCNRTTCAEIVGIMQSLKKNLHARLLQCQVSMPIPDNLLLSIKTNNRSLQLLS